jgi:hypothetical protein
MPETITQQDFFKSLGRLEALANGSDQEQMDKSQICTGPNSEVTSWPGGTKGDIGDKWDDSIGADGTDYAGGAKKIKKAREEIAKKILKGMPLDPNEVALLKSDYESNFAKGDGGDDKGSLAGLFGKKDDDKDEDKGKKKDKGRDKKKDEEEDEDEDEGGGGGPPMPMGKEGGGPPMMPMGKSFADEVQSNETLRKGIEVSEFLSEFAKSFAIGLHGMEARIMNNVIGQVVGALNEYAGTQAAFNKSLADAIVNIGHGVSGTIQQAEQMAQAPAGPPKSQLRAIPQNVNVLQKGQQQQGNQLTKAQMLDRMADLVEKGKLNSLEVIKFESTNQLSPATEDIVMKSFNTQAG